jgi:hypothetical protein
MKEIRNCYFKSMPNGPQLMSGMCLPKIEDGPFHFIDCEIHVGLWEAMQQIYKPAGCLFTNTYIGQ